MAELDLVEERLISGTGVLRVPSVVEDTRYLRLNIDVIRQVPQPFESFKWSPPRSRYCTLVFLRDGYVIEEQPVDYERRQFEFVADSPGQTLIAVKCMYKGLLETFVNLGNALLLLPFIVANNIEDYENLRLLWDEVRVACEGSTAVQVRLFALRYDDDCESSNERKLPPPPPPLPKVEPNTAIGSISEPYNDDNVTNPNPLDTNVPPPDPFPIGEPCQQVRVEGEYFFIPNDAYLPFSSIVYGPIEEGIRIVNNEPIPPTCYRVNTGAGSQVQVKARGVVQSGCGCQSSVEWCQLVGNSVANRIADVRNVIYTPL